MGNCGWGHPLLGPTGRPHTRRRLRKCDATCDGGKSWPWRRASAEVAAGGEDAEGVGWARVGAGAGRTRTEALYVCELRPAAAQVCEDCGENMSEHYATDPVYSLNTLSVMAHTKDATHEISGTYLQNESIRTRAPRFAIRTYERCELMPEVPLPPCSRAPQLRDARTVTQNGKDPPGRPHFYFDTVFGAKYARRGLASLAGLGLIRPAPT